MIQYTRPPRPNPWPTRLAEAEADLRRDHLAGDILKFPEHWKDYKDIFERAQFGKCGFCESKVTAVAVGAVEHHAPKSEVHTLGTPGRERPDSSNLVQGTRKTIQVHACGYWWRAYDWNNWLYACERCNSAWKRCLYPVAEVPHPAPDEATPVTRLLLHPFDDDPLEHLDFDEQGFILARAHSARGFATIETCGLDRESVRKERARVARSAWSHAMRVAEAINNDAERIARDNVQDLLRLGGSDAPWAGVVRAAVRSVLKIPWADLPALVHPD